MQRRPEVPTNRRPSAERPPTSSWLRHPSSRESVTPSNSQRERLRGLIDLAKVNASARKSLKR